MFRDKFRGERELFLDPTVPVSLRSGTVCAASEP